MNHICLDGRILPADEPALPASNRGYRYGDGLFETMRVKSGRILLEDFHFERLFSSLARLDFEIPGPITKEYLGYQVLQLCEKNECPSSARVRLSISGGNGGLSEPRKLQYLVECWPINTQIEALNTKGFTIDTYPDARKHYDQFSDIKSGNYLPYLMAARFAKKQNLDDALVLNLDDRIVEASIANIFLVKDDQILTPSLQEGCIAGVMRRWLIEKFNVLETVVYFEDLVNADEVFLSNAIYGIRWVKQLRTKSYSNDSIVAIHDRLRKEIWV